MFLFYYVWGFFMYIMSFIHPFIEKFFLARNNPFLMTKRTFKFLSYFEKLFLVLFYRKGWFEKSLAYLYRKKDVEEYRRKNYPLINLFHLFLERSDYKFDNLKIIVGQFYYFNNSKVFEKKLTKVFKICFRGDQINFTKFLIIEKIFFKKYYNTFGSYFFKSYNPNNIIKLNYIFNVFLLKSNFKLVIYDLNNWYDWYKYTFNKKMNKPLKINFMINKYEKIRIKKDKRKDFEKLVKRVRKYRIRLIVFSNFIKKKFSGLFFFRFSFANFFKLKINSDFKKLVNSYYMVRFNESSIIKYINSFNLKNYNFFYLRKNRIFNKGRYSRNRQLYRTGVYWCLWLNIIMVYGLYFIFYRFSFNFGYIWWGVLILAYSTIFSRIVKYNFFNIFYVIKEFSNLQRWYGYIINSLFIFFKTYFKKHFILVNIFNYIYIYQKRGFSFIFKKYYYYTSKLFFWWLKKKENMRIVYLWQGMKEQDKSFFRYKTILHWIKEIIRMFTTW